jgi:hypothetical protein
VEKEVARLETEIGRLVAALAAGTASADITTAIADRRAQVAALQVAPALTPVTKARYLTGYAAFRVMLNSRHPLAVRQVLRKLGCDRITITRTGEHTWDFAGEFDAGCLIEKGPAESTGGAKSRRCSVKAGDRRHDASGRGPRIAFDGPTSIRVSLRIGAFRPSSAELCSVILISTRGRV